MIHFTRPKLSYTRQYIYHNEDILAELDGDNNLITFYIHGPGIDTPLAMMRDRNLDGIIKNNEVFVYTRDHQSSVRELTDLNGVVVQRYDYTAYGETTVELNGEVGDRLIENPYGYTGRVHDRETGCYYYRARWYCPSLRIFLSPDPIGFGEGSHTVDHNPYAYVRNNPLNYVDPTGNILKLVLRLAPKIFKTFKKLFKQLDLSGPKGTRVCQVRFKKQPIIRLDYGPYKGTKGKSRLHLHLPRLFPKKHIPLDPRRIFDE